jgi:signal transduction histidine kinase
MKKRLLVAMVGLVGVVLIAHDVPLSMHLSQIERDRLTTAIERDAFTIGGKISPALPQSDPERQSSIDAVLAEYAQTKGGTIVVVDRNGYLLSSTDASITIGTDYAGRPEIATALLGDPSSGTRLSNTLGGSLVYVAVPVLSGAEVLGAVRITFPKTVLDKSVRDQLQGLLLAAGVSVAMAIVVALVFARTVSKPLDNLRATTDVLASGDLTATAVEEGPGETRQLARSFNAMAKRLGGLIDRQRSFAADASHQLRTPLTALRLRLEQAGELVSTSPEQAQIHIDEALNETDRLAHLVEQLLHLARSEGAVLSKEQVDVSEMLTERVREWTYLAEERGVSIAVQAPTNMSAFTNRVALREIVDNYIDNALEVSKDSSSILLVAQQVSGSVEVIVRDEGRGLSAEDQARAFDRFWRTNVDSNRRGGSGLGLAIVAQLAHAAGMTVELRTSPAGGIDAVVVMPPAPQ